MVGRWRARAPSGAGAGQGEERRRQGSGRGGAACTSPRRHLPPGDISRPGAPSSVPHPRGRTSGFCGTGLTPA